jgi:hypothetical protein
MSTSTVHCHILGGNVSVVSDLNGQVTNVICPEFLRINHMCTKKVGESDGAAGILGAALDRIAGTRTVFCEFTKPGTYGMGKK